MAQRLKKDLYLYQGDDKTYTFTLTIVLTGLAWDLSAASSVKLSVKQLLADVSPAFAVTITNTGSNDWANGIVVATISNTQSGGLTGDAVYDLEVVIGSTTTTPCYGILFVQLRSST